MSLMYLGKKKRFGGRLFALLAALLIVASTLFAVPAYAADGSTSGNPVADFFGGIAQTLGLAPANDAEPYAAGDVVAGSTVSDGNTTNDWLDVLTADGVTSTQNIGRIWTDKSVFTDDYTFEGALNGQQIIKSDNADFLVGLSALSSTSNLKTVTTTTTPLDIVLVLDVSGSMDNGQGDGMGYVYTEAYNPSTRARYYVQDANGEWHQVRYDRWNGWYYEAGWNDVYVEPKTSANDNDPSHTQFYTRESVNKMEALQSAANSFVDSVATLNDNISETNQQHRISLVKFASDETDDIYNGRNGFTGDGYNRSMVMSDLTPYTTATSSSLKNTINNLYGEGATQADFGLHQAQRVLNGDGDLTGARKGAQKVVIFFTDGNPTSGSSWENQVASNAVEYAGQIKDSGALIYSIGVVQGADPSDDPTAYNTSNINKFLHAVSSNYKEASYTDGRYGWNWSFGTRTPGEEGEPAPNYYYAAEDSAQLDQVFEDITSSITSDLPSGSPIEEVTSGGAAGTPGVLTFTDELGAYMEVSDSTMSLAYADGIRTSGTRTEERFDGGVTYTYPFSGTVDPNEVYDAADLSTFVVKVTHYDDAARGDKVEVTIPASLIPMRNYDVDADNDTMSVSQAYPVRLFYGVKVKDAAAQQLADPTSAIYTSNYVANNKNGGGTAVQFYSNLYTNTDGSGNLGDTTAKFTPSNTNNFYYFTSDTPLYTDESCTTPAMSSDVDSDATLYYKATYWVQTGTPDQPGGAAAAEERTVGVALDADAPERDSVEYSNGNAYLPRYTHESSKIEGLYSSKAEDGQSNTATAADVLNPTWDDATHVNQRLGNNGRLALELPATLQVTKQVAIDPSLGDTVAVDTNKDFPITVAFTQTGEDGSNQMANKTVKARVISADGTQGGWFDFVLDQSGARQQSIKHGETLEIGGLPAGATYAVTEAATQGYTASFDGNQNGTLSAGATASTTVTNTYALNTYTLSGSENFKLSKNLTGRDWRDGDTFTFHMTQLATDPIQLGDSAIPADVVFGFSDQSNNTVAGSFGDIQFTQPGTYNFYIGEITTGEAASLPGVTYSQASYQVTVVLTDNGDGTMASSATMMRVRNDGGASVSEAVDNKVAAFTNTYNVDETSASFTLDKNYTDNSGAKPVEDGDFSVRLTAVGGYATDEGAPTDGSSYSIPSDDVPMPEQTEFFNTGLRFTVAGIPFDGNDVGNTYVYRVAEVQRGEANMTYDKNSYEVSISVAEVEDSTGATAIVPTVTLPDGGITFYNTFDPRDAGLGNLGGSKRLNGRDMAANETFGFTLTPTGATVQAVEGGIVTMPVDPTATVSGGVNGVNKGFTFGDLTFSRAGSYTFAMTETHHNGVELPSVDSEPVNGMRYDRHTCNVTVTVGLNDQNNLAVTDVNFGAVEVNNNFTNTYTASYNYGTSTSGGLDVSKTLNGRNMLQGEFEFTIAGAESELSGAVSASDADAKLTDSADKSFSNGAAINGIANVMNKLRSLTFNQNDAGKTFVYTVSETQGDLPRVTYDANTYTVAIAVFDDGDGTMRTTTTVYNGAGGVVSEGAWDDHAAEGNTVATVPFVNTYDPNEASLTDDAGTALSVNKRVTGAPTDADFNFTLLLTSSPEDSTVGGLTEETDEEGTTYNVAHAQVTEDFTADDVANGTVHGASFGDLTFDKPGTYTFLVVEDEAQGEGATDNWPAGWKYDDSVRRIQVEVTDVNPDYDPVNPSEDEPMYDGNLYIDSVSRPVTFTNRYNHGNVTLQGDTALQVKKAVTGHTTDADFSFTLKPVEAEGVNWETVEYDGAALNAAINDGFTTEADLGAGNAKAASFGAITFTEPGTYQFTVTEDQAHDGVDDPEGWTYDEATHTITVTVSETNADGQYDGQLHATVTTDMATNTDPVLFTNTYTAGAGELTGEAGFKGTKTVEGRPWLNDESFGFTYRKGDVTDGGDWSKVTYVSGDGTEAAFDTVTATATENGNVSVSFWPAGTFKFAQAGTYVFNVSETSHNGSTGLPEDGNGMTYDRHTGTITVAVTDDGSGTLQTQVTYGDITEGEGQNNMTFVNTYAATPVTYGSDDVLLGGTKTIPSARTRWLTTSSRL